MDQQIGIFCGFCQLVTNQLADPMSQVDIKWKQTHRIHGAGIYIYIQTYRGYIDGIHVTIYSSTMDPMGI
jgi:hypothetical protein